jgi:hypothetical protein
MKDKVGVTCSKHRGKQARHVRLAGKAQEKKIIWRARNRWEANSMVQDIT